MQITTKRFLLRDFVQEDGQAFLAYHAHARSLEYYEPQEAEPGHAEQLLERFRLWSAERPRRNYQLAIVQRHEPQTLIGCCGLRMEYSETGRAELGVELAPTYWGRYGYALEVVQALCDFGFGELGLQEIYGSTVSANDRIARLARSFGAMAVTRPTPAWMIARGWSQVEWQITREKWECNRRAGWSSRDHWHNAK